MQAQFDGIITKEFANVTTFDQMTHIELGPSFEVLHELVVHFPYRTLTLHKLYTPTNIFSNSQATPHALSKPLPKLDS
jgi:hypothetical protein